MSDNMNTFEKNMVVNAEEQSVIDEKKYIFHQLRTFQGFLHSTSPKYKNNPFKNMETAVNVCINNFRMNCEHSIIQDSIDITPNYSKTIYYCEICEIDFTDKTSHLNQSANPVPLNFHHE